MRPPYVHSVVAKRADSCGQQSVGKLRLQYDALGHRITLSLLLSISPLLPDFWWDIGPLTTAPA